MIHLSTCSLIALAMAVAQAQAQCIGPPVNVATLDLTNEFEGFVPNIYDDPTGNPTVGYGHLCADPGCSDVPYPIPLSEGDGTALLASDMAIAQDCITNETAGPVTLNANEYGALCDWAFNIGCGAAGSSTLVSRLNAGEPPQTVLPEELPKWIYSGGEVLEGLVRRRDAEVALAQTATADPALPAC